MITPARERRAPRVAVIGAGLAGACAAWALAVRGAQVTVFEAHRVASGASGAAAGMLQPLIGMRLNYHAQNVDDFWRSRALIASLLTAGVAWRPSGVLRLVKKPKHAALWEQRIDEIPPRVAEWKEGAALRALEPRLRPHFRAGVWIPDACMVDVPALIWALLRHADAQIHEQTRILAVEDTQEGVLCFSEAGRWHTAFDAIVIASGAQAPEPIADPALNMVPYLGIMATYKNVPPPAIALNYRGYITAWHDDSLLVGTVDRRSGFDEEPTAQSIAELQGRLETVLELNTAPTLHTVWKGLRPALEDRMPIAQQATGWTRAWVFTGFGGRGLMVGPRMAESLADEILA